MHARLLNFICCPQCKGQLELAVYERSATSDDEIAVGSLKCACGMEYAIWRGVPRLLLNKTARLPVDFVQKFHDRLSVEAHDDRSTEPVVDPSPMKSLDVQWSMYQYGELTWQYDVTTRVKFFHEEVQLSPDESRGALVLDAGCGNGTLSAALAESGPEIVAFDFSNIVERAEQAKSDYGGTAAVHFVQADVVQPPFKDGIFDVIFSGGVLHQIKDTRQAFDALASLTKPGGRMFVSLPRRDVRSDYQSRARVICTIRSVVYPLPHTARKYLCFLGAVIQVALLRTLHVFGFRKDNKVLPVSLKACNMYDLYMTPNRNLYVVDEVSAWFKSAGFPDVKESTLPILEHMAFGLLGIRGSQL